MGGVNMDTPLAVVQTISWPSRMAAAKLAVPDSEYSRESSSEPFQEHLYKVLVIGDFGVGESLTRCLHTAISDKIWTPDPTSTTLRSQNKQCLWSRWCSRLLIYQGYHELKCPGLRPHLTTNAHACAMCFMHTIKELWALPIFLHFSRLGRVFKLPNTCKVIRKKSCILGILHSWYHWRLSKQRRASRSFTTQSKTACHHHWCIQEFMYGCAWLYACKVCVIFLEATPTNLRPFQSALLRT